MRHQQWQQTRSYVRSSALYVEYTSYFSELMLTQSCRIQLFPLFGLQMYNKLGLGWGNSLLAFVSLALCPIPFLFYKYGERLRTHPKFQIKF